MPPLCGFCYPCGQVWPGVITVWQHHLGLPCMLGMQSLGHSLVALLPIKRLCIRIGRHDAGARGNCPTKGETRGSISDSQAFTQHKMFYMKKLSHHMSSTARYF